MPSPNDLLGYLLNALEPDERAALEAQIEREPQLEEQLALLRRATLLLGDTTHFDPPAGLAARTCAAVAQAAEAPADELVHPASDKKPGREPLGLRQRAWRAVDMVVAVGVCVAAVALIFPLIHASRAHAQVAACANKLREIGLALTGFSERHGGLFPQVAEHGAFSNAGVYAPTLIDAGFLGDSRAVICPGSPLAERPDFRIPTLEEIREANPARLGELRRVMGGSYGYALGYRENGKYKATRNHYRDRFALAADIPDDDFSTSPNHGRCGYNALLEDGHVIYLCTWHLDGSSDDIFRNDLGQIAAGCHADDAVIARSDASPSP